MSQHYIITNLDNRKIEVGIDASGAVSIVKKWVDTEKGWIVREMIINGDEWDRINEARKK